MEAHATSISRRRMTSRIGVSCTSTSYIDSSRVSGSMPWDMVRLPCGSMSQQRTRWPSSAKAAARFNVVVVLATPPFWFANAMTFAWLMRPSSRARAGYLLPVLEDVLSNKRIVICAGPGGVGKTTTSAAIAAGLAAGGARVAVITIDPARRLADALGLDRLDDTPRRVPAAEGELFALMLDSQRTFDALIDRVAPTDAARDEVLANPIYKQLSSAVAGTQEFTAIAKLHELDLSGAFDVLVLDTPPSRNALDFLDAPDRLTGFLRAARSACSCGPGRLLGVGTGVVFSALRKATGVALLDDLSTFFRALGHDDPRARRAREHVKALLHAPDTAFLLVTSLEREPVARRSSSTSGSARRAAVRGRCRQQGARAGRRRRGPARPRAGAAVEGPRLRRRGRRLAARDADGLERLREALDDPVVMQVPQLAGDVHDADGLAHVGSYLFRDRPRAEA